MFCLEFIFPARVRPGSDDWHVVHGDVLCHEEERDGRAGTFDRRLLGRVQGKLETIRPHAAGVRGPGAFVRGRRVLLLPSDEGGKFHRALVGVVRLVIRVVGADGDLYILLYGANREYL